MGGMGERRRRVFGEPHALGLDDAEAIEKGGPSGIGLGYAAQTNPGRASQSAPGHRATGCARVFRSRCAASFRDRRAAATSRGSSTARRRGSPRGCGLERDSSRWCRASFLA